MSKQMVYFLTIFLLNRLMTQFFLFALDNSKHKKGKSCLMGKILGTYYWQNDMIIKFTIIVIILSYIFRQKQEQNLPQQNMQSRSIQHFEIHRGLVLPAVLPCSVHNKSPLWFQWQYMPV